MPGRRRPLAKPVPRPALAAHGEPAAGEARGLLAWRLDLEEDAFALLELPVSAAPAHSVGWRLSRAEQEVVELVLAGLVNAEIARRRGTSARTVANQIASIFRKTGARSRAEVCALAAGVAGIASAPGAAPGRRRGG